MALTLSPAVDARDVCRRFGGTVALDRVSLSVPRGSMYGIIGADGAGKTTLLSILCTLLDADSGGAAVLGFDTAVQRGEIRKAIGHMPQRFSLYQDLTVAENLAFFADVFGVTGDERVRHFSGLLRFARLEPFVKRRAGALSGGMKQKLALCCCLVHRPDLIMLDEPTVGVDPVSRAEFWHILGDLKSRGVTIVVTTPYMDETGHFDRLALMHRGRVLREGPPGEILAGFPYAVYRVRQPFGDASVPLPAEIVRAYHHEGHVRAIVRPHAGESGARAAVDRTFPSPDGCVRVAPSMEDLFIDEISP